MFACPHGPMLFPARRRSQGSLSGRAYCHRVMSAPSPQKRPVLRSRPRLRSMFCAPPEVVAEGVTLLRGGFTRHMNAYLIDDPGSGGVVLYDTGEKGMAPGIAAAARDRGGLAKVVLGHADTDHRGSAPALRAYAPVVCHPDAVEQAQGSGGRDYWQVGKLPLSVQLIHRPHHRFIWDGGPVTIDGTVREGDVIAGFEVIDLPGHAPGLIGLWRERDRVALVSDLFYMSDMHGKPCPPVVPLWQYNLDSEQARASIRKLAALKPKVVCPGHLGPLTGPDVVEQLERAAAA
jgi:hydroxyacylglutathione hydrolase